MEEDSYDLAVDRDVITQGVKPIGSNQKDNLGYRKVDAEVDVDEATHIE